MGFVVAHVHLVGTFEIRELVATLLLASAKCRRAILQPEMAITSKWRACDGNEPKPRYESESGLRELIKGRGYSRGRGRKLTLRPLCRPAFWVHCSVRLACQLAFIFVFSIWQIATLHFRLGHQRCLSRPKRRLSLRYIGNTVT